MSVECSIAQQLVDLMNEHLDITEVGATAGGEVEYLVPEFGDPETLESFVMALFAFADRIAPPGYHAVVGERTGFKLEPDKEP